MKYSTFAPWEHYPRHLTHYEVLHPMRVLEDFFGADSLNGHNNELKRWQKWVTSNKPYKDKKHGPVSLQFTHNINVRLLEAMFLLLLEYRQQWPKPESISEDRLKKEKQTCTCYPDNLSIKELANPYKVISKAFDAMSLPQYREQLQNWLDEALTRRRVNEHIGARELLTVYGNLLKLYSAAWLIYQRSKETIQPSFATVPLHKADICMKEACIETRNNKVTNNASAKKVEHSYSARMQYKTVAKVIKTDYSNVQVRLTRAEELSLEEVVKVILQMEPAVAFVGCIGLHHEPFTYYLLILVNKQAKANEYDLADRIETRCKPLTSVFPIVHKVKIAVEGISRQKRFWTTTLANSFVAYQSPELSLPEFQPIPNDVIAARAAANWQRWGSQAKEFLSGARFYHQEGSHRSALFLLHQSAESALIGLFRVLMGFRLTSHNLNKMIRLSQLFTDELRAVFHLDTEEGRQTFHLLQGAYTEARYKSDYQADAAITSELIGRVEALLGMVERISTSFIRETVQ